jgi:hypothetical protein
MLCVKHKPFMLSVVMLSVIMLGVVMLSDVAPVFRLVLIDWWLQQVCKGTPA